ncbi:methyltransferase family protein [Mycobacterium shimoidei]|uniref:RemK protein [Niastella koreensis GR20-10] n=1 Tax=Mycobacterium shimoidei TaxID=29313 RepID=A0A1E3TIA2_MYCSH|nr:isoprenylcysteine carboxylmethyltransferase family protein [Mycobacterium shimoidei]MCV7257900.1 isoprenylcysteine carboxylmethyltransferase family protein [Mycobacterium shimoidei]ODR14156.1 RemK protein [Mycobacterium shimoidei]ORW83948.1 RemK protein [Mycobacterium shimoidei]SRX91860.1 RemK protein [Niastella koreensis GR20-10] [Mycobacterium shimoidei]
MVAGTHGRRLWWRHLLSFLLFPVTMTVVIPALIAPVADVRAPDLGSWRSGGLAAIGALLIIGGVSMLIWTVALFHRVGQGTLGVGSVMGEPVHLVVRGPYRHVRNPMISGVLCILLGESALTMSTALLVWFAIFLACQTIAIRFWEEPHLIERYGQEYLTYRDNVPRWIPRISAWRPSNVSEPFAAGHHGAHR